MCTGQPAERTYARWCESCHGAHLQGWAAQAERQGPGLAGVGLAVWWWALTRLGSVGRYADDTAMPAYSVEEIDDQRLGDILDYLVAGADEGSQSYAKACASCHGVEPSGGGKGPPLAEAGLVRQWTVQSGVRQAPPGAPTMPAFSLCEADRAALAEYLVRHGREPAVGASRP